MASATATPSKPPAELYFGGAADERSRLVLGYAQTRRRRMERLGREVYYFAHRGTAAALRLAQHMVSDGRPLALIGHSWGADSVLRVAQGLKCPVFVIGADAVAKPGFPFAAIATRPASAKFILHIDAAAAAPDRSDFVKAAGHMTGGGLPRAFRDADARIPTRLNHWNFAGMMTARGEDGRSAEDWLDEVSDL